MRRIGVIGTGYVGLVTGACLVDFGNSVVCMDTNQDKIEGLKRGRIPIYEPGLKELIERSTTRGRLTFSTDIPLGIKTSQIIFIAVWTPALEGGDVDISDVLDVAGKIAEYMEDYKIIVNKSTVSVGTGAKVEKLIREKRWNEVKFDVVSNPEFLREGSAIEDFMRPNRVVIGARTEKAMHIMAEVYRPLYLNETPIVRTDVETAEMIKYASNAFLAAKISFINEIANICEGYGADVKMVAKAMGLDGRIGPKFLHAGPGFGGNCLPKDVRGLASIAAKVGVETPLIDGIVESNQGQSRLMVGKLKKLLCGSFEGKRVGVLGLSFKPNTDDIREAPALVLVEALLKGGTSVRAFDPEAMENTKRIFPQVEYCKDPYEAAVECDAIVLMTEWNEFRDIDFARLKETLRAPNFLDCRNVYDPDEIRKLGFNYVGVGRGYNKVDSSPR